jgi:histidyl-tRNA synthetase
MVSEMSTTFQPPRGTRDFLPEEMARRQYMIDTVRKVFESFGFEQLDTPAFESWELLSRKGSGGEAVKDEIYYFTDKSDRALGLRFDLTVPLARVIADNPQLKLPFKRYQTGKVWRYDRPQAGRMREFLQMDVDTVGTGRMEADAECIAVAFEALRSLGFKDFEVRLNNRKVMDGLMEFVGILKKKHKSVFRALDKLEKVGTNEIASELGKAGIEGVVIRKLMKLIDVRGRPKETLGNFKRRLKGIAIAQEGIRELEEITTLSSSYGFSTKLVVDFSLVRGLDYYTGPIFEISVKKGRNVGSVAGGGRYDDLVALYGGKKTPATGISLGIERIYEIMKAGGMFPESPKSAPVFVISVKDETRKKALEVARKLRDEGLSVETDVMGRNIGKQLEYAGKKGAPYAIIVGPKELKAKKYVLRNMKSGKESRLSIDGLARNMKC